MIDDIARETVSVTAEFLYAAGCLLCLICCSQQQNRNSVVCDSFLWVFHLESVFEQQHHHWAEGEVKSFYPVHRDKHRIVLSCLSKKQRCEDSEREN